MFDLGDRSPVFVDSSKRLSDFSAKGISSSSQAWNAATALVEIGTGAAMWGAYGVGSISSWGALAVVGAELPIIDSSLILGGLRRLFSKEFERKKYIKNNFYY